MTGGHIQRKENEMKWHVTTLMRTVDQVVIRDQFEKKSKRPSTKCPIPECPATFSGSTDWWLRRPPPSMSWRVHLPQRQLPQRWMQPTRHSSPQQPRTRQRPLILSHRTSEGRQFDLVLLYKSLSLFNIQIPTISIKVKLLRTLC